MGIVRFSALKIPLIVAALAFLLLSLGAKTAGLRLASVDDVFIAKALADPAQALANRMHDFRIGRIYADWKFDFLERLMREPSEVVHGLVLIACFALAAAGAAWFVWEWTRARWLVVTTVLLTAGWVQISVSYQALLSYPLLWLGWAAIWVSGAVALRWTGTRRSMGMLGLFAVALAVHEANAVFVIWPALIVLAREGRRAWPTALRSAILCGVVLGGYGAFSLALRTRALEEAPLYDGARVASNVAEAGFALGVFSAGALPGLEPWFARMRDGAESRVFSPGEWAERTLHWATAGDWVSVLLLGATIWVAVGAMARENESQARVQWPMVGVVVFAIFAPNLLLACTQKYQVWAHQRMWPYYYSSMSYLGWTMLAAYGAFCAAGGTESRSARRVRPLVFAAVVMFVAAGLHASSREAIAMLRLQPLGHATDYRAWLKTQPSLARPGE